MLLKGRCSLRTKYSANPDPVSTLNLRAWEERTVFLPTPLPAQPSSSPQVGFCRSRWPQYHHPLHSSVCWVVLNSDKTSLSPSHLSPAYIPMCTRKNGYQLGCSVLPASWGAPCFIPPRLGPPSQLSRSCLVLFQSQPHVVTLWQESGLGLPGR